MLKTICIAATAGLFLALATGASADPWKDESGNGNKDTEKSYEGKGHKIERYEGGCKIEEKSDGDGSKKEIKCDDQGSGGYGGGAGLGLPGLSGGERQSDLGLSGNHGAPMNIVPEVLMARQNSDGPTPGETGQDIVAW